MQNLPSVRRTPKPSEEGFLLLAVMFLMAILVISLAVAAPNVARSIQRDREVETMHRGKQYIRAVQLYYRKFHAYPPNVDALVKTNEIRFLRKRYIDPMTGKDDWKPILFGQNKVPTAMGFFGQPLSTGGAIAGIGPTGGNGVNGANGAPSSGGLFNSSTGGGFGSPTGGSSIFSSPTSSTPNLPAPTSGSTDGSSASTNGAAPSSGSTDSSGNSTSGTGGTGTSGPTGQTFGGAGIIGFSPASSKQSILIYKKKDHYNEWEFTYDPIMDMQVIGGGNTGAIGQPASTQSNPVGIPGITTQGTSTTQGSGFSPGPLSPPPSPPDIPASPQQ
jgi:type II secretory pathway pseudopilin PulG